MLGGQLVPGEQLRLITEKQCMEGLMGFLSDPDTEVVITTLQTMVLLSSPDAGIKQQTLLMKLPDFFNKIVKCAKCDEGSDVKTLAAQVLANLAATINGPAEPKPEPKAPVKAAPKYQKRIPLQIREKLAPTQINFIERELAKMRGVNSVHTNQNELVVITEEDEQELGMQLVSKLKERGFTAMLGHGQDQQQEQPMAPATPGPSGAHISSTSVKRAPAYLDAASKPTPCYLDAGSKKSAPAYLDSGVSKENGARTANATPSYPTFNTASKLSYMQPRSSVDSQATAVTEYAGGSGHLALEARLRRQREEQQNGSRSILGAVTGAVGGAAGFAKSWLGF